MATSYEDKARKARTTARHAVAAALGLALADVDITADAMVAKLNVNVLLRAVIELKESR